MPLSIEIFGIRGFPYDAIRSQLQQRLDSVGVEYTIEDVQKIDEFIAEGLEGVPTVRVDHKKCFTKTDHTTPEEVVNAVVDYILAHSVQHIICPIDFSEYSIHAASWALQLSKLLHMQLRLIHVYRPISEVSYTLTVDQTDVLKDLRQKLADASKRISPKLPPTTSVLVGDPLQSIVRISKDPSTGMIVMGTRGTTGLVRKVFGTISAAVARHTYAPVLLIPPHAEFRKPRQILVAFHEELLSTGHLKELIEFNRPLHAHLQFAHVQEGSGVYPIMRSRLMDKLISSALPEFSFDIQEIQAENMSVLQALLNHAEKTQPDMIVFVTRQRNLVRRLLYPGLTQQMTAHLKWPLLVMRNA